MPIINIAPTEANQTFFKCIKTNENVLCFYYWKQCFHCQQFAPLWNKISTFYKDKMNILNIELESVKKLDDEYKVMGFPSIMVYRNGKKYTEFNKARNENNLHDFIQKNMLKTIKKPQIKRVIAKPIRKRAIRNKPKQK
jgi:thioredoxin-like negative regulator of GroEL